ncbi:unnamed protein product [Miscanthus lutarioriparius]|uniref:X8 domain-containing protein n=1 Tax=Miscanthus lutarioriparius TaxID=422564 RepID=A0A811SCV6_9POAL|nr:unnamed protein product [Miscanthus lutarioriparius]
MHHTSRAGCPLPSRNGSIRILLRFAPNRHPGAPNAGSLPSRPPPPPSRRRRRGGVGAGAVGVSGGAQLWCVAKNNAEDGALQSAIDWACSVDGGRADCAAIQQGGACFDPPDLQQHASYAFNDYFLRSGGAASPAACDFSGAAALTALNPSKNPESLVHAFE